MNNENINNDNHDNTTPNLPIHTIEQQTFMAKTFADGAGITGDAAKTFVAGWLNGYAMAMREIGAIDQGDTDAEMEFLRNLRK